jgi:hypothetical protein
MVRDFGSRWMAVHGLSPVYPLLSLFYGSHCPL